MQQLAAREGVERGADVVAQAGGFGVVVGRVIGVKDGEGIVDSLQRGGEGGARIGATVMGGAGLFADRDVLLRHGPIHRMIGAGADLKGGAVGGDGLGEERRALGALRAGALKLQGVGEVVLAREFALNIISKVFG